jgi:glycosyltransferase involved in cell wall biosynthesis
MGRLDPNKGAGVTIQLFKRLAKRYSDIQTHIFGYAWHWDLASQRLHEALLKQREITYTPANQSIYNHQTDFRLRQILSNTDILFLPYIRLSSTIDTPLVLLEGMAHLCAVVTRPLGDLPYVYGRQKYMFTDLNSFANIESSILKLRYNLENEQRRIHRQNEKLKYRTSQITRLFLKHLGR